MSVDDFTTLGKRMIDPWKRVGCCKEPLIILVEFCQAEGPKPLYRYPRTHLPHINVDSLALWLMSSEVLQGSTVLLYNQQLALHVLIYYSVLLDVRARGFQRPICLAFLTSTKPTSSILKSFMEECKRIFLPVVVCNRNLFKFHLNTVINFAKSIGEVNRTSTGSSSESAYMRSSVHRRIESLITQACNYLPKIDICIQILSKQMGYKSCENHSIYDMNEWMNAFGTHYNVPLSEIRNLLPCAYERFIEEINNSYKVLIGSKKSMSAALYCGNRPLLFANDYLVSYVEDASTTELLSEGDDYEDQEKSLRAVVKDLDQILFPVLIGDRFALCASEQRKPTALDLLQKLSLIRPAAVRQSVLWIDLDQAVPSDCFIFGQSASRKDSADWSAHRVNAVLDLNGHRLRSRHYDGDLLSTLSNKGFNSFPSDRSLLAFIAALLTEFCSFVYIASSTDPEKVCKEISFHADDKMILANFLAELDCIKYSRWRDSIKESTLLSLRLLKI